MRRASVIGGCVGLAIFLVAGVAPSQVFAQIVVSPVSPTSDDPLVVTASSWCPGSPATIHGTSVVLSAGLIKITADVECGMLGMPELFSVTENVPPRTPGIYVIEFWVTSKPYPLESSQITVLEAPVAAGQSTWGAIKALYRQ